MTLHMPFLAHNSTHESCLNVIDKCLCLVPSHFQEIEMSNTSVSTELIFHNCFPVVYNGVSSSIKTVKCGVPQGANIVSNLYE